MPLAFYNRQGKLTRCSMTFLTPPPIIARQVQPEEVHGTAVPGKRREFPPTYCNFLSLPQLVRCFRYKDLYDNVLFNYQV